MSLDELIEGALTVPRASVEAAESYGAGRDAMCALVNAELRSRPDVDRLIGGNPLESMDANHGNHAEFMATVLALGQHELLARTLPWVYRSYRGRGFAYDYFPVELEAWARVVERCLPAAHAAQVLALYEWMLRNHQEVIALSEQEDAVAAPVPNDPWAEVRDQYLFALLEGDAAVALTIARKHAAPESLEGFFLSVVQPAMYAIGERWESGTLSIAHEHLASAITSRVISALYTLRKVNKQWRGVAVVAAAPNEFHEIGALMVSDLLELDGWAVNYLGANTPLDDLVTLVRDRKPALVGLSVTMPFNLERARATIAAVRGRLAPERIPFLVGGRVFNIQPSLQGAVGADAWARNARDAVVQARTFGQPFQGR